jgi:hypothetical protein
MGKKWLEYTFKLLRITSSEIYNIFLIHTPKYKIAWATGKFGLCSSRPKTVFPTDLFVALTDKAVVIIGFARCLKKLKVIDGKN